MSLESAKAYIDRMKTDEDFAKKVTDCKDVDARKAFILKEGYDFTDEEFSEEDLKKGVWGNILLEIVSLISGFFL